MCQHFPEIAHLLFLTVWVFLSPFYWWWFWEVKSPKDGNEWIPYQVILIPKSMTFPLAHAEGQAKQDSRLKKKKSSTCFMRVRSPQMSWLALQLIGWKWVQLTGEAGRESAGQVFPGSCPVTCSPGNRCQNPLPAKRRERQSRGVGKSHRQSINR